MTRIRVVGGAADLSRDSRDDVGLDRAFERLERTLSGLGFHAWAYTATPCSGSPPRLSPLRVTTYPTEHVDACLERGLYPRCPGLMFALRNRAAHEFSAVRAQTAVTRELRALLELNRRFDVTLGMVVPLHEVQGATGVLAAAFGGSATRWTELWSDGRAEVEAAAHTCHQLALERHRRAFTRGFVPVLSARQRQLLEAIARGETLDQIARRLEISIHTVNKHVAGVRALLGAKTNAQLTALTLRWGLL